MNDKIYKCTYFEIEELVPHKVFKDRGEKAWELLDSRLLLTIDNLRRRFGKMTINNWKWNGDREWSGLRTPDSPYYSQYSQHSFGRAADIIFDDFSAEEIRQAILQDIDSEDFQYIGGMELGTSWLHIDMRNSNRIKTFYP